MMIDPLAKLIEHERACSDRYREIIDRLSGLEPDVRRNTKILWTLLAGVLGLAIETLWMLAKT